MKIVLATIFLLIACSFTLGHHKRVALLISRDENLRVGLIDSIKLNVHKFYKKNVDVILIDSITRKPVYDEDSLAAQIETIKISKDYSNEVYLTSSCLMHCDYSDINFFPIYGHTTSKNVSVISLYLMDSINFVWQSTNVVIHELGHQFGLFHCDDTTCIMYSAGYVDDRTFCKNHKEYLNYLIRKHKL